MAEYSLLLALVAILAIATFTLFALQTSDAFDKANDGFNKRTPTTSDDGPGFPGDGGGDEDPDLEGSTPTTSPDCDLSPVPVGVDCTTTTEP